MRDDLKHGLRMIRRQPAFSAAVVLLLALGIGTATTVFSLVEAVLLNPLPYPSPERLAMVWETQERHGGGASLGMAPRWYPRFRDAARSFESLAAVSLGSEYRFEAGGEPELVVGAAATSSLFRVLGAETVLGRALLPEDDRPGSPSVAVLSHGLWTRSLGADPGVLGRTVELDGASYTVVGVLAPGFDLVTRFSEMPGMDVWTPLDLDSLTQGIHNLYVVGRLAEGVTRNEAQAEMETVMAAIRASDPKIEHGVRVVSLHDEVVGRSELQVVTLFGAAAFILLIVCANAGGLLVAKTAAREGELAIRASLGANRGGLIRQLMAENLVLGALGGLAGIAFAGGGVAALRPRIPADIPRAAEMGLDGSVLAFTAAATLVAVVLLGLAPAVLTSGAHLAEKLRQGRSPSAGPGRSRRLLVVVQLALTLVLAHGAALMLLSWAKLRGTDMGFDPEVLTTRLVTTGPRYESPERVTAFVREAVRQVGSLAETEAVAVTDALPLYSGPRLPMRAEGREDVWDGSQGTYFGRFMVTPGFFRTLGIGLVAGRLLSEEDMSSEAPVALVNRAMARQMWAGEDPIGRRFGLGRQGDWITVVGVVEDVRQFDPEQPPYSAAYVPLHTLPAYGWTPEMEVLSMMVSPRTSPESLVGPLRRALRSVDPSQPVADVRTLGEMLRSVGARRRFNTLVMTSFAGLGVVMILAGIYALMSTFVARRTRDIGVRMALGADTSGVLRLVLGQAAGLLALGVGVGLAAVFAVHRMLAGLLYAVSPTDPVLMAGGVAFVGLVALLGSGIPALRAARIDPASALRDEVH